MTNGVKTTKPPKHSDQYKDIKEQFVRILEIIKQFYFNKFQNYITRFKPKLIQKQTLKMMKDMTENRFQK